MNYWNPWYPVIAVVCYLWLFWGLFVLVMGLLRARLDKRLNAASYVLGAPFLVAGWLMDFIANMTLATVLFLELPRELMVSARLKRHNQTDNGWRTKLSTYICQNLLDIFDPSGDHC